MQNYRGNLAEPRQSALVELCLERPPNARSREPRGDDPQLSWRDLVQERTTIDEGATPLDQSVLAKQLELPADRRPAQTDFPRDRRRTKRSNGEQGDDASTGWVGQEFDPTCGALRHRVMIAIDTSQRLNRRFARYFRLSGSIVGGGPGRDRLLRACRFGSTPFVVLVTAAIPGPRHRRDPDGKPQPHHPRGSGRQGRGQDPAVLLGAVRLVARHEQPGRLRDVGSGDRPASHSVPAARPTARRASQRSTSPSTTSTPRSRRQPRSAARSSCPSTAPRPAWSWRSRPTRRDTSSA